MFTLIGLLTVLPDGTKLPSLVILPRKRQLTAAGYPANCPRDKHIYPNMATRKLAALTYVPVNRVIDTFELLVDDIPDVLRPVLDYVDNTYIGRLQRRGRCQPRFAHAFRNVYDRVVDGVPRANNAVEGFHNHMQSSVMSCHPNIWAFIKVLQLEQRLNDQRCTHHPDDCWSTTSTPAPPVQRISSTHHSHCV